MSRELTPEQRLTQIERLLESAVKLSHSNTAKIEANTEMIDRSGQKVESNTEAIDTLTTRVDRLTEQMGRATEMFIDSMGVIRTMQTEIKDCKSQIFVFSIAFLGKITQIKKRSLYASIRRSLLFIEKRILDIVRSLRARRKLDRNFSETIRDRQSN